MSQIGLEFDAPHSFRVIRASAGAGKTTALVRNYLELTLQHPSGKGFRSVLAVTFTNKAAAEMKERILDQLERMAKKPSQSWNASLQETARSLQQHLRISETELRQRAARQFHDLLHQYSDFRVETIDHFFHGIVRSFAFDFGLSRHFTIETDTEWMLSQVADEILHECGRDRDLTDWMTDYIRFLMDAESSVNMERRVVENSRAVVEDAETRRRIRQQTQASLPEWGVKIAVLREWQNEVEARVRQIANEAMAVLRRLNLSADDFMNKTKSVGAYLAQLAEGEGEWESSKFRDALEGKWFRKGEQLSLARRLDLELGPILKRLSDVFRKDSENRAIAQSVLKYAHVVALLPEVRKRLDHLLRSRQSIHISDLGQFVHGIVEEEPVPFLFERAGTKFQHYLIDEFQDTSHVQFQNFLPLLEQSISTGHLSVVVGDAKQSIYRFRGTDWKQFANLPELRSAEDSPWHEERQDLLRRAFEEESLTNNYRSGRAIVQFNNELYEALCATYDPELRLYRDAGQSAKRDVEGFVRIAWDMKSTDRSWRESDVEQQIRRCLEKGYRQEDIVLLCRRNAEAERWAELLLSWGFDVISPDCLLLDHQPQALLILAILGWQLRPSEKFRRGQMLLLLDNVCGAIDSATMIRLIASEEELRHWLTERGWDLGSRNSVYETVVHISDTLGLSSGTAVMSAFLDTVLEFATRSGNSVSDFLEWWETRTESLPIVPSETNAIQIMTIHKAKGLEFPIVIVPECDWKGYETDRKPVWVERDAPPFHALSPLYVSPMSFSAVERETRAYELVDMVNLLYVTTTRARDALFLYSTFPKENSTARNVGRILQEFLLKAHPEIADRNEWCDGSLPEPQAEQTDISMRELEATERGVLAERLRIRTTWSPAFTDARSYGDALHRVLAVVRSAEDLEDAEATARSMGLEEEAVRRVLTDIQRLIERDPQFFSPGLRVRNEYEIILDSGRIGRMDKLIEGKDAWTVIEYKTGRPDPTHEEQVREYLRAVQTFDRRPVRGVLLYTDQGERREVI